MPCVRVRSSSMRRAGLPSSPPFGSCFTLSTSFAWDGSHVACAACGGAPGVQHGVWGTSSLAIPASSPAPAAAQRGDRKSTRLNSSHVEISYAVFCLKKKKKTKRFGDLKKIKKHK